MSETSGTPTADIEKIARDCARHCGLDFEHDFKMVWSAIAQARALDDNRLVTEWHKGFAACLEANAGNKARAYEEARAPLVEALEEAISFMDTGKGRSQILIDKCRAALTGTGENVSQQQQKEHNEK